MKKARKQAAPKAKAPARYTMKTLDQVRVLAHPLRLKLLEAFAQSPSTTQQVAQSLGMPATRLYHHVNALERVGLIRLRETRPVRGTVEKYYEAIAKRIEVGAKLFAKGGDELGVIAASVIEEAARDLKQAMARGKKTPEALRPLAVRGIAYGTPEQLAALRAKLVAVLKESGKSARPAGASAGGELASARITIVFATVGRNGK